MHGSAVSRHCRSVGHGPSRSGTGAARILPRHSSPELRISGVVLPIASSDSHLQAKDISLATRTQAAKYNQETTAKARTSNVIKPHLELRSRPVPDLLTPGNQNFEAVFTGKGSRIEAKRPQPRARQCHVSRSSVT